MPTFAQLPPKVQPVGMADIISISQVSTGGPNPGSSVLIGAPLSDIMQSLVLPTFSADFLGARTYSASASGGVLTEVINGITVTTTVASGVITAVYGSPIFQTWQTTVSAGVVTTSRTA